MVKKLISTALIICFMTTSLVACKTDDEKVSSSPSATSSATAKKTATAKASTSATQTASPAATSPATSSTGTATPANTAATATPAATDNGIVTDYSIEYDFQVIDVNIRCAGFVFGYVDETQFLMWQISIRPDDPSVYIAPHRYDSTWDVFDQVDITDSFKFEDAYKKHHMKIDVNAKNEVNTYIDGKLIYTCTDPLATYGKIGIRQYTADEAYFDNIVITNTKTSKVLQKIDFNDSKNPFLQGEITSQFGDSPALHITDTNTSTGNTTILN